MPFTISHAAAVLPLRKLGNKHLPLAALMIGSMSPDFAHFLPGFIDRAETHRFTGLFWFCWPTSLAAWFLYVRVLELPTITLLPRNWRTRFAASDRQMTPANLALASFAVLLGAATHQVWDSFTHRGTMTAVTFPALHSVAFHYEGWRIRWFVALQHLSTLLGLAVLAVWAWRLPPGAYPRPTLGEVAPSTRILAGVVLIAGSLGLATANYLFHSDAWFVRRLFYLAVGGMTGWLIAWFAIAIVITARSRRT